MRLNWVLAFCVFGVVACAPVEDAETPADTCGAADFEYLKWQKAEVLADVELPKDTRIIRPEMAVTMDFRQNRLNISVGKSGRIENIRCG